MFSETALPERSPRARISLQGDMRHRATLTEWMDEPCSYQDLRCCLRDLGRVSRIIGAHRPILRWLDRFTGDVPQPLHVLDVGCGGGDLLRRIEQWAKRRCIPIKLTGIDLNPDAIRVAREF